MQIGDIVTLGAATPITRVIFDYNRNCTCVRVNTEYNSYTDREVMPLKKGCTVWICSKREKTKDWIFRAFKMREVDAVLKKQLIFSPSVKDIEDLKTNGEIDAQIQEFLKYALEKLA